MGSTCASVHILWRGSDADAASALDRAREWLRRAAGDTTPQALRSAILRRYGATSIRVSESGVREGAILAVEHAGPAWRDRLADLAHGWRT